MIDHHGKYLMMYRSDHPLFGDDPDLPGGRLDDNESLLEALLREVREESGVEINPDMAHQLYSGTDYSQYGIHYALYLARFDHRPNIDISWEHSAYEWLDRHDFLKLSAGANDQFMHMVAEVVSSNS